MFKIYSIIIPLHQKRKGECIYILNKHIKYYAKETCKLFSIVLLGTIIIIAVLLIKFKPAFAVTYEGEKLGYVNNKNNIEEAISEYENSKDGCIAYVIINEKPEYEFKLIDNAKETVEEEVLLKVKDEAVVTYRMFAIKLNGETKDYVEKLEQAEALIESMKEQYENEIEMDLTIEEIYTENVPEIVEIETAKAEISEELEIQLQEKKAEEEELARIVAIAKASTSRSATVTRMSRVKESLGSLNLIKPLDVGVISSRFGAISSIRPSTHKGLDIAAPKGTDIKAAEKGVVTFAGRDSWYGNCIIIQHKDGIETCYAHCSKLYVSVGDVVEHGDIIAAVGSTGNSTGNHLHFEIRKNGVALNPQHYLYN